MFWAMMFGTFKPTKKRKIQKQKIPCDGKTKVCKCKYDEHGNKVLTLLPVTCCAHASDTHLFYSCI